MRLGWHRTTVMGRAMVALLLVATLVASLVAPVGLRRTVAQDEATIQTRVQVLHAATDLGEVEVYFNGDEKLDEFGYGDVSDWLDVDPGTVWVMISRDRAGFNYSVFDVVYPVLAGQDFYLVITDALVMGSVVNRDPVADGMARVRITHASVDTPEVNVATSGTLVQLATELGYGRTSEYVQIPAGTYDTEITLVDTGEVLATLPAGSVEAGRVYDFQLVGTPGDDDKPLTITPLVDDGRSSATPAA
jgi:hypothetical protein